MALGRVLVDGDRLAAVDRDQREPVVRRNDSVEANPGAAKRNVQVSPGMLEWELDPSASRLPVAWPHVPSYLELVEPDADHIVLDRHDTVDGRGHSGPGS